MPSAIKAIAAHPNNGRLTALRSDYSLVRQEPDFENVLRWRPVDTTGLPSRIAHHRRDGWPAPRHARDRRPFRGSPAARCRVSAHCRLERA
jgi:hypothetical protein